MDEELEWWPGAALDQVAVEIGDYDVIGRQGATGGGSRVDEERFVVAARAAVTAVIDDVRARQHANRIDQLLLDVEWSDVWLHFQGSTATWMAPGAPCPPTDLMA